jgi:hypothetical protein
MWSQTDIRSLYSRQLIFFLKQIICILKMIKINKKIGLGIPDNKLPKIWKDQMFTYVNFGFLYIVKFQ